MESHLQYDNNSYILQRYPKTTDNSLRAWSNAELLALKYISEKQPQKIHLFNDRFGIWNCTLNHLDITSVFTYASQQKAVLQNLKSNNFSTEISIKNPLENFKNIETALVRVPKSLELFELFLQKIHNASSEKTEVICCFMTKYFSASILKIASIYFENLEQSKAWKKARLLILKNPKKIEHYPSLVNTIDFKNNKLKQYYGVFSSEKIDIGTQFLLENITLKPQEKSVLDVASGNGIIAHELTKQNPNLELSLLDDFNLAIASSKINLKNYNANFIWDNNLNSLKDNSFDFVISNPPFHFEHENNIDVSISLFKDVKRVLKQKGRFVLVANKHLNYKTHLSKLFDTYSIVENDKFIIYECKNLI